MPPSYTRYSAQVPGKSFVQPISIEGTPRAGHRADPVAVRVPGGVGDDAGRRCGELVERVARVGVQPEVVVAALRVGAVTDPLLVVAHHEHRSVRRRRTRSSSQSICSVVIVPVVAPGIAVSSSATITPGSSIHWSPAYSAWWR